LLIGRFPLYTDLDVEELEKIKFDYVLDLIKKCSIATYEFIKNAPDGVLRVIGPFEAKKSKSRLIISSPVPMIFQNLLLELPRVANCVVKRNRAYVDILEVHNLFSEPSEYVLKVFSMSLDLETAKDEFKLFIGKELDPRLELLEIKRFKGYMLVHLKTFNKDASALINFLRFSGLKGNRDKDVLIWRIENSY
jgi:hypothetical protein